MRSLRLTKKGNIPIIQQSKVILLQKETQSRRRNLTQKLVLWIEQMSSSNTSSDHSENITAKAFNDVTQYRKRKRRVTQKLTLLGAMKEFKQKTFPTSTLPDLEIYLLSLITHRVSPRIPKRKKWAKIKDLMKTTLYQFNRKRLQTFFVSHSICFPTAEVSRDTRHLVYPFQKISANQGREVQGDPCTPHQSAEGRMLNQIEQQIQQFSCLNPRQKVGDHGLQSCSAHQRPLPFFPANFPGTTPVCLEPRRVNSALLISPRRLFFQNKCIFPNPFSATYSKFTQ